MKNTALIQQHQELGAKMVPFAGYNMPLEYSGVINEHMAVREAAGMFDVSHMGEFWIKGDGALSLLQKVTTNNVATLAVGQAQYTCMPNGKGGIVDDLIVYRYSNDKYMAVVNASNMQKDWDWIVQHNTFGAEMENASDQMSLIALQGPKAIEILQKITKIDLTTLGNFEFAVGNVGKAEEVIISGTGYTGAGGVELYCYNDSAATIWEELLIAGKDLGLVPAGLAARDTLRLEMGYCLYGNDIDDTTSPIAAGLGWIVKFAEGKDFIDKELLYSQKANGVERKLTGIELIGRGIPRKDYVLVDGNDNKIGVVTSGTMSPVLKKGIGMAYINTEFAKAGTEVYVKVRNKNIEAKVVRLPFI
jgi:aminomethyltransferase